MGLVVGGLIGCAILAAIVLSLVVPAGRFPLFRKQLFGIQVELPVGAREVSGDYGSGKVRVKTPLGRLMVQVSWQPGAAFEDAELLRLLEATAPVMGARPEDVKRGPAIWVPGGLAAQTSRIVPPGKVRCRRMDEPAQVWRWAPGQSTPGK